MTIDPGSDHLERTSHGPSASEPAARPDAGDPERASPDRPSDPASPPVPPRRPLARDVDRRWLAGVAAGVAEHLDLPVGLVRVGFVLLALVHFLGVAIYGLLWVLLPERIPEPEAPGLEAARRQGLRSQHAGWQRDAAPFAALALLATGIVWLTSTLGWGLSAAMLWPALFAVAGVALVWRQADVADVGPLHDDDTAGWLRPFLRTGGWLGMTRLVVGLGLVGLSVSLIAASRIGVDELPTVLTMSALMILGVLIAGAPWMYRLRRNLTRVREEKLVADARADMAAHLHDSVLQSLALIQRRAADPKAVTAIARRQERELRDWLYGEWGGGAEPSPASVRAALADDAQRIEADRGVAIEVVGVGDAPLTEDTEALVAAAREAMVNAAKHSGCDRVDVYAEVDEGVVEVFVRDRGAGFTLDGVDTDRLGVRRSIIDRMERHGGSARIRSAPGEGTEIELRMSIAP